MTHASGRHGLVPTCLLYTSDAADWIGPTQGQLDPLKEIQAEKMANENGYSTRAQSAMRLNGTQYEQNVEVLRRENAMLQAANVPTETSKGGIKDAKAN